MKRLEASARSLLSQNRAVILSAWRDRILDAYPPETRRALRASKDPFRNPVGAAVAQVTAELIDELIDGATEEEITRSLDGMVRLRAVQDVTPANALGFLFDLKDVVRETVARPGQETPGLIGVDRRIDEFVLLAFNVYAACREQIMEIRVSETNQRLFKLLQRMDDPEARSELAPDAGLPSASISKGRSQ